MFFKIFFYLSRFVFTTSLSLNLINIYYDLILLLLNLRNKSNNSPKINLFLNVFNLNRLNLILFSFLLHIFRVTIPYLEQGFCTLLLDKSICMVPNLRNIYDRFTISSRCIFQNLRRYDWAHY